MAAHVRIAWYLNLDADRELQDPSRYRPTLAHAVSDWSTRITDLVDADDLVLDSRAPAERPEAFTVRVFCPTPRALAHVVALGFSAPLAPTLAILQAVNDRAFCAALGQCLTCSSFVTDMVALDRHLLEPSPTGSYVIKRAFSFAGRERRRVHSGVLDPSTRGFCARSFANGEGVQIEPWVERLADFSKHGYLTRTGALVIGPTREQHCDPLGRFLKVSSEPASVTVAEEELLSTELQRTASALTAAGYFGPFGIDAFRYKLPHGQTHFNPRCEINARFTMGYPRALMLEGLTRDG